MNHGILIFLGALIAVSCSWYGMLFAPQKQIGSAQPEPPSPTDPGAYYPSSPFGDVTLGREVYRAQGCAYCHTRMVRADVDVPRWGARRSVARDYLFDEPVVLGSQRIGPDLANVGLRRPDAGWHYLHLFNPQLTMPEGQRSQMPPYAYLFETRPIGASPSPEALQLTGEDAPEDGYEVVPTRAAKSLVTFMRSLRADNALFEAPIPETAMAESDETESDEEGAEAESAPAEDTPNTPEP